MYGLCFWNSGEKKIKKRYDKGFLKIEKKFIMTLPEHKKEKEIVNEAPQMKKYFKAFKRERAQIEQNFGRLVGFFGILGKPFKGRGRRYTKLGQMVLLGTQLINLNFEYEKSVNDQKSKSFVEANPPKNFAELLKRCWT